MDIFIMWKTHIFMNKLVSKMHKCCDCIGENLNIDMHVLKYSGNKWKCVLDL